LDTATLKSGEMHGKDLHLCYLLNSKAVLPFGYFLLPFGNRASTFGNQHKAKTRLNGRAVVGDVGVLPVGGQLIRLSSAARAVGGSLQPGVSCCQPSEVQSAIV
jgi:hypothetical protein